MLYLSKFKVEKSIMSPLQKVIPIILNNKLTETEPRLETESH